MILVDTAVWIDHLHAVESKLVEQLELNGVGCHPLVIEELSLGSIARRDVMLDLLADLWQFPTLEHHEVMQLIRRRQLWGRGLGVVDVHLMASVAVTGGAELWTRDKRLKAAASDIGVAVFGE